MHGCRIKPTSKYSEPVHNVNVQQLPSCPMLPGTGSQAHHPPALPLRICMYSSIPGAETDSDHGCGDTSDDGRGDGDEPPNIMDDDTLSFCYSHGIDPASLPDPDPVADPGLSFWSLLKAGDASRVTVEDLKVMAGANQDRVLRENNSVSIFVRHPLCGRLSTHGEPAQHDLQRRAVRLRILDAMYDELIVDVVDPEFEALTPAEFAAQAVSRFPGSTAVALVGLELEVKLRMFASAVWCGAEASEREAPRGVVHRLGTAALPPPKLSQVCCALRCARIRRGVLAFQVTSFKLPSVSMHALSGSPLCTTLRWAWVECKTLWAMAIRCRAAFLGGVRLPDPLLLSAAKRTSRVAWMTAHVQLCTHTGMRCP